MKLVMIYGPPAAGKLTVAQAISEKTGFPVFHNQHIIDVLRELFTMEQILEYDMADAPRIAILKSAAQAGIAGIITTLVYDEAYDDEYMRALTQLPDTECYFVHLVPSPEVLQERVVQESRKQHRKLMNPERLAQTLEKYDLYTSFEHPHTLRIDNSTVPAHEVANRAIQEFSL